jgi:hypothetical protein
MSENGSGIIQEQETPNSSPQGLVARDEKDKNRGKILLGVFIAVLVGLGAIYVGLHIRYPAGPFSPISTASQVFNDASAQLASVKQDLLEPAQIAGLTHLSDRLGLLAPRLGLGAGFSDTLAQIKTELGGAQVHLAVLSTLFDHLGNIIQTGSGSIFWSGSLDRAFELLFWSMFGTLVFLISEVKKWYAVPFQEEGKRDFVKFTPWYVANFFRGPFIAFVVLLALTNISFEAIGVAVDVKAAPIEVLVLLAAIMGYYSRVADKQLDIIAEFLLSGAWKKAHPAAEMLVIEPNEQPVAVQLQASKQFNVKPNVPVQWYLQGDGTLKDGNYTAPEKAPDPPNAILLAVAEGDENNVARLIVPIVDGKISKNGVDAPPPDGGAQSTVAIEKSIQQAQTNISLGLQVFGKISPDTQSDAKISSDALADAELKVGAPPETDENPNALANAELLADTRANVEDNLDEPVNVEVMATARAKVEDIPDAPVNAELMVDAPAKTDGNANPQANADKPAPQVEK